MRKKFFTILTLGAIILGVSSVAYAGGYSNNHKSHSKSYYSYNQTYYYSDFHYPIYGGMTMPSKRKSHRYSYNYSYPNYNYNYSYNNYNYGFNYSRSNDIPGFYQSYQSPFYGYSNYNYSYGY